MFLPGIVNHKHLCIRKSLQQQCTHFATVGIEKPLKYIYCQEKSVIREKCVDVEHSNVCIDFCVRKF